MMLKYHENLTGSLYFKLIEKKNQKSKCNWNKKEI